MPGDAGDDLVESRVVVELPPEGGDILGTSPLQQEPALVVVEPESHDVGEGLIEVHADGVAAEAPPVRELLGFDDDVAEVHVAEDASHGRVSNPGSRNSVTSWLNSSARSHCIQWPVCEVITSSALGMVFTASVRRPVD